LLFWTPGRHLPTARCSIAAPGQCGAAHLWTYTHHSTCLCASGLSAWFPTHARTAAAETASAWACISWYTRGSHYPSQSAVVVSVALPSRTWTWKDNGPMSRHPRFTHTPLGTALVPHTPLALSAAGAHHLFLLHLPNCPHFRTARARRENRHAHTPHITTLGSRLPTRATVPLQTIPFPPPSLPTRVPTPRWACHAALLRLFHRAARHTGPHAIAHARAHSATPTTTHTTPLTPATSPLLPAHCRLCPHHMHAPQLHTGLGNHAHTLTPHLQFYTHAPRTHYYTLLRSTHLAPPSDTPAPYRRGSTHLADSRSHQQQAVWDLADHRDDVTATFHCVYLLTVRHATTWLNVAAVTRVALLRGCCRRYTTTLRAATPRSLNTNYGHAAAPQLDRASLRSANRFQHFACRSARSRCCRPTAFACAAAFPYSIRALRCACLRATDSHHLIHSPHRATTYALPLWRPRLAYALRRNTPPLYRATRAAALPY